MALLTGGDINGDVNGGVNGTHSGNVGSNRQPSYGGIHLIIIVSISYCL